MVYFCKGLSSGVTDVKFIKGRGRGEGGEGEFGETISYIIFREERVREEVHQF